VILIGGSVKWFLLGVALLHAAFMALELFPWESPFLLGVVSKNLPAGDAFTRTTAIWSRRSCTTPASTTASLPQAWCGLR
jgi:hypothetical protein